MKAKVSTGPGDAPRRAHGPQKRGPPSLVVQAKLKACQENAIPPGSESDRKAVMKKHWARAQKIQDRAIKALEKLRDHEFEMMMESKTAEPFFGGSLEHAIKAVKGIELGGEVLAW